MPGGRRRPAGAPGLSARRRTSISWSAPTARVDERDTMFARAALSEGTPQYRDYYERRPGLKEVDDRLRALPELMNPGGRFFDPQIMAEADGLFAAIAEIAPDAAVVDREAAALRASRLDAGVVSRQLRSLALSLGAVAAGWAPCEPAFVYTHKGRFPRDHGRRVDLGHGSVLVFLVEMDHAAMAHAPLAPTLLESARQYYRAAVIALTIEAVIHTAAGEATDRASAAKAHYDAHYDLVLPPLAVRAGLGELGRNNILVADRHGSRVRIGAVSTSLEVVHDEPVSLGVAAFCRVCRKCAENCPARALSPGEPVPVRGVPKWPTEVERCYRFWRISGTDCGVCMAVCPFSHGDTWPHTTVRRIVRTWNRAHRALVLLDDLVYGRRWPNLRSRGIPGGRSDG